jgi:hypothetical protein
MRNRPKVRVIFTGEQKSESNAKKPAGKNPGCTI